jgi:signal transduction histidine kinase
MPGSATLERVVALFALLCAVLLSAPARTAADDLPAPEYDETLELIELVANAATLIATEGPDAACVEFNQVGSEWFQDEIYVFVFDLDGVAVCHPAQPALEGQTLLELRDPSGRPIIRNSLRELEGGSDTGWVHYLWPKPESRTFVWKTTHIQRVTAPDGTQYIVGSGLYEMPMERFFVVEQVNDAVELIEAEGEEAFFTLRDRSTGFRFYDAYVFVLDPEGIMLVNVGFPDLENTSVAALEDSTGKLFVQEMLAVPKGGSAWVDYRWPKPGEEAASNKSSYLRRIEVGGREYIVGAGVYFR